MSIPVELDGLRAETDRWRLPPYLLTTGDDGRPHAVALVPAWEGSTLVATAAGRRTLANARARSGVSLLWPPSEPDGYSLIVDATAAVDGEPGSERVILGPTRAVLHRPAPPASPDQPGSPGGQGACSSDCVPILDG